MRALRQSLHCSARTLWSLVLLAFSLFLGAHGTPAEGAAAGSARTLTLDDRVACQRAIEAVNWQYRIWPKENPRDKPTLDEVMALAVIRAKVEDDVRKAQALGVIWGRPLTAQQLQRELERMARATKQPARLRALWAALGNDPVLVAECVARPNLANRLIRSWYAREASVHEPLARRVREELKAVGSVRDLTHLSGDYEESTFTRGGDNASGAKDGSEATRLSDDEWRQWEAKLGSVFDGGRERGEAGPDAHEVGTQRLRGAIPVGVVSPLEETDEAYRVTAVLEMNQQRLRLATVSWRKRAFADWWAATAPRIPLEAEAIGQTYRLPAIRINEADCEANDTWRSTPAQPEHRYQHTAVWTGTEMIVWGGIGAGERLTNTGERYDPATDTWMTTNTVEAPTSRRSHTAVWTGVEMIVWGGEVTLFGPLTLTDTGGRYDPATDTWVATSTLGAPTPRSAHTAVWTGTEMIAWGGLLLGPTATDTGGRYDPANDSWVATSTMGAPTARSAHTAVWTGTRMIVWGGDGPATNRGGRYDPATDTWAATSTLGAPTETKQQAVWTGTEMIVWSGLGPPGFNAGGRYDPGTDTWVPMNIEGAPSARQYHTAVWTGTQMIIWGGRGVPSQPGDPSQPFNTGGRYDPANDSWVATSTMGAPTPRFAHTAVWTGTEMIVWGGLDAGFASLDTGGRYDPVTETWRATNTAGAPSARYAYTAVWTGAEMIVWGGLRPPRLNTGGRYDPATDTWVATSTLGAPSARYDHTAVWTGTEMIVWGGLVFGGPRPNPASTGGRYDPATDTWIATSTAEAPFPRYVHKVVWTGTEMIVWGGIGIATSLNTGGRYDPATDTWMATSTVGAPTARYRHTAVWTGTEMIVWGVSQTNTGGRYDPATDSWMATSTVEAPSARDGHTAVWTGTEMIVWGGILYVTPSPPTNTGGRYDPATDTWVATSTAEAPSARSGHTAVWTGTEMIVWGGAASVTGEPNPLNTGGRYDPATDTWMETSTAEAPTARYRHTAVWTGAEMIVWGGVPTTNTGGRYCASRSSP